MGASEALTSALPHLGIVFSFTQGVDFHPDPSRASSSRQLRWKTGKLETSRGNFPHLDHVPRHREEELPVKFTADNRSDLHTSLQKPIHTQSKIYTDKALLLL